jgi:hypothetical protein
LICTANVVVSSRWGNGSDLLFQTMEWKPIPVWTGYGTAFFFAGLAAPAAVAGDNLKLWKAAITGRS